MPNHLHVVVTPVLSGASSLTFIDRFKGWSSREIRRASPREKIWQPRSYDHLLREDEDLHAIEAYILGNPVRAGLSSSPEEYPWCGIPEPIALAAS
jgi:REP-associated tyrosine transposase